MDKLLIFHGRTEKGIFTHVIDSEKMFLEKTAAEYHPKIAEYIRNAKPIEGKTQILLTALGAGEYWGNNVNGDYFPEEALSNEGDEYGHKTFERYAKIYKHHVNKDPTASFGDVSLSVYNQVYHRVELVVVLDNAKAPDIAKRVNEGDYPDWSMGCRVPYDECSICGNRAPTVRQYCEHLKYYIGRIHPASGKMAYAINRKPKFFDISQVLIGADRIAKTLQKVASAGTVYPASAIIAEKMAETKHATIEKEIPAKDSPGSQESIDALVRAIPEVKAREPRIPNSILDSMASKHDLPSIMSTLCMMGILPKPQEFQRIILVIAGKKDVADELDRKNACFDPCMCEEPAPQHERILGLDTDRFNPVLMNMVSSFVPDRSNAAPHLAKRLATIEKMAEQSLPEFIKFAKEDVDSRSKLGLMPLMMLASGLYAAYARKAPEMAASGLGKVVAKHPGLAAALALSVPLVFNQVFGESVRGNYVENLEPEVESMAKTLEKKREKPFLKISSIKSNFSAGLQRVFLGAPAVYMASGILQKSKNMNPQKEEAKLTRFIRRNPDIIGGALALDGIMALSGKGSHGVISKLKAPLMAIAKHASVQDFIMDSAVWPLAFGARGLPGRVVGGIFDQAVLEGSKKLLSKKKSKDKI